jgi:hypothetical protein
VGGETKKTVGETEISEARSLFGGSLSATTDLSGEVAGAKVGGGALKSGTTNVSQVVGGVTGGLAVAGATGLLVCHLIKRRKPQSEEEEAPKRFLPEPLLDEIEVENPLTAANGGFELEPDGK